MSTSVANIPPIKVWVRREHLRDMRDGYGEYTLGYWVSVKSIPGRALYFETYLPEYGATFDKLTIDAFLQWDSDRWQGPQPAEPDLPVEDLQFWNGFDYGLTVIEKNLLSNMEFEVRTRSNRTLKGKYLFTIDNYHPHRNEPDLYFTEVPDEHKSHNIIELENGQIGAYPNNRCRMTDPSLSYNELKTPDFKVATRYIDVEHAPSWGRLGEQDDYFWETPQEKDAFEHVERNRQQLPFTLEIPDIYTRDEEWADDPWEKQAQEIKRGVSSPITYPLNEDPKADRFFDNRDPGMYGNVNPHRASWKEIQENPWDNTGNQL